jgi:hypothetical protein
MTVMPNTMPEGVPQHTYVATGPNPTNFLAGARSFHQIWGLKPINVSSLEDVISDLAKRKGKKARVRIVTHANFQRIFLSLFRGGREDQEITAELLNAFAKSDVMGLTLLFKNIVDLNRPLGGTTVLETILTDLRANAPNVLIPFGLAVSGSPGGALLELFQRSVEQLALQMSNPNSSAIRTMRTALDIMLDAGRPDGLRRRVRNEIAVTANQVRRLGEAIRALNLSITPIDPTTLDPFYIVDLEAAVAAVTRQPKKDGFRNNLTQARKRFADSSVIDIRGCQAGASLDYLKAVANFFGSNSTKPKVTGPDFFQSFPTPSSEKFLTRDEAATLISLQPALLSELDHWALVTGHAIGASPPPVKLLGYCDRFVLAVPEIDPLTGLHEGTIVAFILGRPDPGSSGFLAITHWLDSQWLNHSNALEQRKRSLRTKWSSQDQAPPISALSKFISDTTTGQEIFVVPDPRYMTHIKST